MKGHAYKGLLAASVSAVIACNAPAGKQEASASELCFLNTAGNNHQDSTQVHLSIKDSVVSGEMIWMPFEKDSRKGKLLGTKNGPLINVLWTFMQEGMQDSIRLQFKYDGDHLHQKPLMFNETTSREETNNNSPYTTDLEPVNCIK